MGASILLPGLFDGTIDGPPSSWDPDDPANMLQNFDADAGVQASGGPAGNGDAVTRWDESLTSTGRFFNANGTITYRTNVSEFNGHAAVEGDGLAGSYMLVDDAAATANQFATYCTIVCVARFTDADLAGGVARHIFDGHTGRVNNRTILYKDGAGAVPDGTDKWDVIHSLDGGQQGGPATPWTVDENPHLFIIEALQRNTTLIVDDGPVVTCRAGTPRSGVHYAEIASLFAASNGTGGVSGAQISLLRVYPGVLSDENKRILHTTMLKRYGLGEPIDNSAMRGWWILGDGSLDNKADPANGTFTLHGTETPRVIEGYLTCDMRKLQYGITEDTDRFGMSPGNEPYSFGCRCFFSDYQKGQTPFSVATESLNTQSDFYQGFEPDLIDPTFSGNGYLVTLYGPSFVKYLVPETRETPDMGKGRGLKPNMIYQFGCTVHPQNTQGAGANESHVSVWLAGPDFEMLEWSTHPTNPNRLLDIDGTTPAAPLVGRQSGQSNPVRLLARVDTGTNGSFYSGGVRDVFIMRETLNMAAMRWFAAGGKFAETEATSPVYTPPS